MGSSPEPPDGWDPNRDSLEDLVRILFREGPAEPTAEPAEPDPPPPAPRAHTDPPPRLPAGVFPTPPPAIPPPATPLPVTPPPATPPPVTPPPATPPPVTPPPATPAADSRPPKGGRAAVPVLVAAILLVGTAAGWQISSAGPPAPAPASDVALLGPPATSPLITPAVPATVTTTPAAEPVGIPFGTRSDVGDGWRLAATRPYPCDVLMAIPVLQQDGTRIIRVTLTLTNRTDAAQPARAWELAATADRTPAELVLWPAARFRGVPEVTLAPGRSTRFLVAVRIPNGRTQVEITARRDATARAVLRGTV